MIASTSASCVLHSVATLPMSRAQFRLPLIYNSSLVIGHSLCNGLRFLSCVSMSLLRATTSNLPWYLILPPNMFSPSSISRGYVPRCRGRMGENISMTIGVGITHMNDSNPRGRSKPNVRLGISHQRFRMLYPRFKLLNWEMYLSYMNISPTAQMHVYVHEKQQQRS